MKLKRNEFNLSHGNGLPVQIGKLVPYYVEHLIPGDIFDINAHIGARFMPMQAPMMQHVDIKTWSFFVPYRLVWEDYKEFFTGKNKAGDDVAPVFPRINYQNIDTNNLNENSSLFEVGSLSDYLDLPSSVGLLGSEDFEEFRDIITSLPEVSILEPRGYQCIYNEWFRDQNLEDPVTYDIDSYIYRPTLAYGDVATRDDNEIRSLLTLRNVAYEKDYFTSALPEASIAGDVSLPVDEIVRISDNVDPNDDRTFTMLRTHSSGGFNLEDPINAQLSGLNDRGKTANFQISNVGVSTVDPNGSLQIDVGTMRDFMYTKMIYQFLLDAARGGSVRYRDFVKTMFGVTVPDYRADVPEYIGGGSQPVIISEVLQTSETNETAQGNMSGRGTSVGPAHKSYYIAKEHGFIMCLVAVLPKPTYASGLPKRHFKFDRFDYYFQPFDHIGDQAIKRKELSYTDSDINEEDFGYQARYAEYKSAVSRVHGSLRSSLSYWTMARNFDHSTPVLNANFVKPTPEEISRPFFVPINYATNQENVILEIGLSVKAYRAMSKKSIPIV